MKGKIAAQPFRVNPEYQEAPCTGGSRKSLVSALVEDKMNSNQKTFEEKEGRVAANPSFPSLSSAYES
jgi:hypothetical protein